METVPRCGVRSNLPNAYCAGSFTVGAALTDPAGVIVAEGRNHAGESIAPDGLMPGTVIAHAEMFVLAQLPKATMPRLRTRSLTFARARGATALWWPPSCGGASSDVGAIGWCDEYRANAADHPRDCVL